MTTRTRLLAGLLVVVILAAVAVTTASGASAAGVDHEAEARRIEALLVRGHDEVRGDLPQLESWSDLVDVARSWSAHQADTQLAHNPDYGSDICCWKQVGENVGSTSFVTEATTLDDAAVARQAELLMQNWMASEGHRANMLHTGYDQFGIGVVVRSVPENGRTRWTVHATADFRRWDGVTAPPGQVVPRQVEAQARPIDQLCADADGASFADVEGTAHERTIGCAVHWELTAGQDADHYGPGGTLTRAQAATFLRRVLATAGHRVPDAAMDHFHDDDGTAHEANINALAEAGVIDSAAPRRTAFRPNDPIRRDEMALMTARALRRAGALPGSYDGPAYFDDVAADSATGQAINQVAHIGVVTGTGTRQFSPWSLVSRAQMATFVVRALDATRT